MMYNRELFRIDLVKHEKCKAQQILCLKKEKKEAIAWEKYFQKTALIKCLCGSTIRITSMKRHKLTKSHLEKSKYNV